MLHCPYCHGFEIGGGSIGIIATGPMSVHQASLLADWGDVTFFTGDKIGLDDAQRAMLQTRAVAIESEPVTEQLGYAFDETPIGSIVRTDIWKQTTIPGGYAAGDNAPMQQSINFAVADGTAAGVGIHQSLIAEGVAA